MKTYAVFIIQPLQSILKNCDLFFFVSQEILIPFTLSSSLQPFFPKVPFSLMGTLHFFAFLC